MENAPLLRAARFTRPLLRIARLLAIFLPGTIHPDEIFQSQEVVAAAVFDYDAMIPWEFAECAAPARSILPPAISVGLPYAALAALQRSVPGAFDSSAFLVLMPRLWLVLLSFVADAALAALCTDCGLSPFQREAVWHLVASSWVTLVLMTRPFSNTLEAWLLLALLCAAVRLTKSFATAAASPLPAYAWAVAAGAAAAFGIFVRFTLPLFAAPLALAVLAELCVRSCGACSAVRRWRGLARLLPVDAAAVVVTGSTGFAVTLAMCALVDSVFFRTLRFERIGGRAEGGETASPNVAAWDFFGFRVSGHVTFTPATSLLYNSDPAMLARHGLHPRFQHAVVNFPLLFGPLALVLFAAGARAAWSLVRAICNRQLRSTTTLSAEGPALENSAAKPQPVTPDSPLFERVLSFALPVATPRGLGLLCALVIAVSLAGLSTAPHQEARFLAPLTAPVSILCVLLSTSSKGSALEPGNRAQSSRPQSSSTAFKVAAVGWLVFNAVAGAFFGAFHQGGLVPALVALGDTLHAKNHGQSLQAAAAVASREAHLSAVLPLWHALVFPGGSPAHLANAVAGGAVSLVTYGTYMAPKSLLRLPAPWAAASAAAAASGGGVASWWWGPRVTAPWCVGPVGAPASSLGIDPALATRVIDVDLVGRQAALGSLETARSNGHIILLLAPSSVRTEALRFVLQDPGFSVAAQGGSTTRCDAAAGTGGGTVQEACTVGVFIPHLSMEHWGHPDGDDGAASTALGLTLTYIH